MLSMSSSKLGDGVFHFVFCPPLEGTLIFFLGGGGGGEGGGEEVEGQGRDKLGLVIKSNA